MEIEGISTTTAKPFETTIADEEERTTTETIMEIESITTTTAKPDETTTIVDEEEQIHELQCKPDSSTSTDDTIAMKCKEKEDEEPITVLISSGLLDLGSFDRTKFKIVVKDLMLMEMKRMSEQQQPVVASPKRK